MENLSVLFGIALSADDDPSARSMACHALCACTCDNFPCPRLSRNFLVFRDAMKKKKKKQLTQYPQAVPGFAIPKRKASSWIFFAEQKLKMAGPGPL